jgi:PAS domain S-box-containing protein
VAGADQSLERAVLATARALTVMVALLAALGLWGRLGGWLQLPTWPPASILMARHSVLGLLLAAVGLALRLWPCRWPAAAGRLATILGLAACALGLTGLVGWLTHPPPAAAWTAAWTPSSVWPAVPLAPVACTLAGLAVWTLDARPVAGLPLSDAIALLLGAAGAAPVVSYAANLAILPRIVETLGLAPLAGLAWTLFAAALLLARPGRGLGAILVALGPGGGVARRMLPLVAAVPVALATSRLLLEWVGWGGSPLGAAAELLAMMGLAFLLVLWTSYPLEWSEQSRREVERQRGQLAALVNAAGDAIFGLSDEGLITSWNRAAEQLYGHTVAQALGRPVALTVPPEGLAEHEAWLARVRQGEAIRDMEAVRIRRDGTRFVAALSVAPLPPHEGAGAAVVSRDVTAHRQMENALRDREARLRGLIEATPDAVFFLDDEGRITAANPAAVALFRQPAEAFLGQRLEQWVCPELGDEEVGPGLFDALAGGATPYIPCLARRPDGEVFPAELSRTRITTSAGTLDVAICRDVSERRHAAEALANRTSELAQARALERLKDHVYSSLSHELKTPLTIIQGNTEMLQEDWPDDPRLQSLQAAVQRLSERIEALLDHAALLGGDMPLYRTPIEASEVLSGLAERYRAAVTARGLSLHVACETALPVVTADSHRLAQALTALVDNAVKFAPPGGHIGVRAREDGGDLVLEVWNSGPGIPPQVLARLGETFYQSDLGNARRKGGLGLGLAIARMLVALHGGTLTVASAAGEGATFSIRLPVTPPDAPGGRSGRSAQRTRESG